LQEHGIFIPIILKPLTQGTLAVIAHLLAHDSGPVYGILGLQVIVEDIGSPQSVSPLKVQILSPVLIKFKLTIFMRPPHKNSA
jgi:hypothetical protein